MLVVVLVAQFTGCTTKIITVATAENPEPIRFGAKAFRVNNHLSFKDTFSIFEKNGAIWVTSDIPDNNHYLMEMNNGYFMGVDLGEFGGHCRLYEYFIDDKGELINENNCYGLFKKDLNNGYLLAGKWNSKTTGGSELYKLTLTDDGWKSEAIAEFESTPRCTLHVPESDILFVVTWNKLLEIDLMDGTVYTLCTHKAIKEGGTNSIVMLNGRIYIGAAQGILEYDLETGDAVWYEPIGNNGNLYTSVEFKK